MSRLACLGMVFSLHKVPVNLEKISREFAPNGEDISPINMLRAAQEGGFKARLVQVPKKRLSKIQLPLIGFTADGTGFVIAKADAERVLFQIPGNKPQILQTAEFFELWGGEALVLSPKEKPSIENKPFGISWFFYSSPKI